MPKTPVKILLVDDLEGNLLALSGLLKREGLELLMARSASEALELLLLHDFALAFLDVQMPGMDGFELAEMMRGTKRTRRVPIIFVTAGAADKQRRFRGYEAGAVDFLFKPIEPHILQSKAEVFFELARQKNELRTVAGENARLLGESQRNAEALRQAQAELQQHAANLEKIVTERTADLRETNEQLEAFVYSIAHDLRAPLRSMQGFSQILMDEHAAPLDDVARNYLTRINHSSEFMDKLIMDLLAFGRVARTEMEFEPVDVQKAWDNALFQCGTEIEKTKSQIETIPPLPTVRAHEATLSQALANLLSNAMKFVPPGVQPRIRFWAEERKEGMNGGQSSTNPSIQSSTNPPRPAAWVRLWIQDNGVGIAKEHQERIFRVFERLQGARYPGTGIGLSIVRKGVERMNGKVGLESEPGKGSRFWIELAKR